MAVAAPARKPAPTRKPPARKPVAARTATPKRRASASPARVRPAPLRAPQRVRPKPKRAPRGHLVPLAAARTAATVRHLPDSGLMVRMTRGRAWIGVLGVLLAGIVALNVITLSFAASTGGIYQNIEALEQDNSIARSRDAQMYGTARVHREAAEQGLVMPSADQVRYIDAGRDDVAVAAQRLAGAG